MPDSKIDLALKEIGFAPNLRVNVQDGVIVSIPKQSIERPARNNIKFIIVIEDEITK